jgi:caa(3)-type oxidase subunit IV
MSEEHIPEGHDKPGHEESHMEGGAHAAAVGGHAHEGPTVKTYFVIFGALSVFTLLSFLFNECARHDIISHFTSFVLIMAVAVCKAVLVAAYFMHLVVDWGKIFIIIVPTLILAPMLLIVLLPDIVLAWQQFVMP